MSNRPVNIVGYWASKVYNWPNAVNLVTCLTSDHLYAWLYDNGYGNFTWVWSAAEAERTKIWILISGVTAIVYRHL